jgi:hypothetical protein
MTALCIEYPHVPWCYAKCRDLFIVMLNFVMLIGIMLNIVRLSGLMLRVVVPGSVCALEAFAT